MLRRTIQSSFVIIINITSIMYADTISKPFVQIGNTSSVRNFEYINEKIFLADLKVWDFKTGKELKTIYTRKNEKNLTLISILSNKSIALVHNDSNVMLLNIQNNTILEEFISEKKIREVILNENKDKFAVIYWDNHLKIFDFKNKKLLTKLDFEKNMNQFRFTKNLSSVLVFSRNSSKIKYYNFNTLEKKDINNKSFSVSLVMLEYIFLMFHS